MHTYTRIFNAGYSNRLWNFMGILLCMSLMAKYVTSCHVLLHYPYVLMSIHVFFLVFNWFVCFFTIVLYTLSASSALQNTVSPPSS